MTIDSRMLAALLAGAIWGVSVLLSYFIGRAAGLRRGIGIGREIALREVDNAIGRSADA